MAVHLEQAGLEIRLLYGTKSKYMAHDCFHRKGPYGGNPGKKETVKTL